MNILNRRLTFSNGSYFEGYGFGSDKTSFGLAVHHTAMVGYQEIISDPAALGQIFVMSNPLIGNYGLTNEDYEDRLCHASGLVVKEYNDTPSNFRHVNALHEIMYDQNIPGISGIDTRKIGKMLQREGAMMASISDTDLPLATVLGELEKNRASKNMIEQVSCKRNWYSRTPNHLYNIIALDLGIKNSTIKALSQKQCNTIVVPFNTTSQEILEMNPDGLIISSGPGTALDTPDMIDKIKKIQGNFPILGIGLGSHIIALANGYVLDSLKGSGHYGNNHPVKNLITGKIEFPWQSHLQTIKADLELKENSLKPSHINLLDKSIEGLIDEERKLLAVEYYPENLLLSQDSFCWFELFIEYMSLHRKERNLFYA